VSGEAIIRKEDIRMLVLGHTGITFGMAVLLREALARGYSLAFRTNGETEQPVTLPEASSRQDDSSASRQSRHLFPAGSLDIRLLLLGSLLPDIIDKPVGIYFFRDTVSSGAPLSIPDNAGGALSLPE
jgi:hypothetical protein